MLLPALLYNHLLGLLYPPKTCEGHFAIILAKGKERLVLIVQSQTIFL